MKRDLCILIRKKGRVGSGNEAGARIWLVESGLQPYWTDEGFEKEMKPMEKEKTKETTKTDESKRLFYEYEPLWPIL